LLHELPMDNRAGASTGTPWRAVCSLSLTCSICRRALCKMAALRCVRYR